MQSFRSRNDIYRRERGANEVTNVYSTGTINWSDSVIDGVANKSPTSDNIGGNPVANYVSSWGGNDAVSTDGGNDCLRVDDGAGGDVVDCGDIPGFNPDPDMVYYDGPTQVSLGDSINDNCETQNPS